MWYYFPRFGILYHEKSGNPDEHCKVFFLSLSTASSKNLAYLPSSKNKTIFSSILHPAPGTCLVHVDLLHSPKSMTPTNFWGRLSQGDQVGRIFAYWVIVNFVQCFENYRSSTNDLATFFHGASDVIIFTKTWLGYILGDFSQTHKVTLVLALTRIV
jgi:hypothetical protein